MTRSKTALLTAPAMMVSIWAMPAAAQEAPQAEQTEIPNDEPGVAATSGSEEIVVTARRRAETLLDVPLSVSVLGGEEIREAGIEDAEDLFGRVPGLYFTNSGSAAPTSDFTYLVLRGVGFNGGQEPSAGVFIDGMYQPQLGFDIGFLDLERLEVLRGPQGTLFGRNTQGGALNIVTRRPGRELEGRAEAEYGRFDTVRLFGSVRGPVTDGGFGAGISAQYSRTDGYVHNSITDDDLNPSEQINLRGTLRYHPNDDIDILLIGDLSRRDGNEIGVGVPFTCRCYVGTADNDREDHKENDGIQLNADFKLSPTITLSSITGWRRVDSNVTLDFDGSPTDQTPATLNGRPGSQVAPNPITIQGISQLVAIEQEFWSQELRLTGSFSSLDWLIGGYYFGQDQRQRRNFDIGPGVASDPAVSFLIPLTIREDFTTDRDGLAGFGQLIWKPIEGLEITAGGRYSRETVEIGGERIRNIAQIENANPTFFQLDGEKSFENFSWLASVSYAIQRNARIYATVATGWKAGGFNRFPSTPGAALPYDSETSTNYELGLKANWLNNRVTTNLAAFYIDIEDQQLLTVTNDAAGVPVTTIANAGTSRSKGFEAEIFLRPTDNFNLSLATSYTHGRFREFQLCAAAGFCIDRAGAPFEFTPEWTASATADYTIPLGEDRAIQLFASYRYVDSTIVPNGGFMAGLGDQVTIPAYDRLDARLSYIHGRFRITGYVDNVFNSYDYVNFTYHPFLPIAPQNGFVQPLAPRTFGAILAVTF